MSTVPAPRPPLGLPNGSVRALLTLLIVAVVLLVLLVTAGFYLADRGDLVPHLLRNITLGLVLFYFGSR